MKDCAWSKSEGTLVQSWCWALNQPSYSHESWPVMSLGSQVVQMQGRSLRWSKGRLLVAGLPLVG